MYVITDENMKFWSNEYGWIDDICVASHFTQEEKEHFQLPQSDTSVRWASLWEVDMLQFARLIEETQAAGGFTTEVLDTLVESMDLEMDDIVYILERARIIFETHKAKLP